MVRRDKSARVEPDEKSRGISDSYRAVAIVGLGLMGGSLALALRRSGYRGKILGVSRPETLAEARSLGAIDEGFSYDDLPAAASAADLVVLASPISVIITHLRALGEPGAGLKPGTVVTDVGSTKRAILDAAACLPRTAAFIGGHPLCGSEKRGVTAADPFLYQNAYYVLTPSPGVSEAATQKLGAFLATTGARMVVLTAEQHDRIAATISHLPQLLAVSLVRFLEDLGAQKEHGVHLAAGGFRDMTRIASSPFSVWKDIVATNRDEIQRALGRFLDAARTSFTSLDEKSLASSFDEAARTRAEIPRDSKGFLSRLWDVLVVVEDRPGMILQIAAPLAAKGVNIQDIEVMKVREGEGGTMRLAFATRELALEAVETLVKAGLSARLRE
ncbi:MAG TPA: prephenate dehydrogenase [Planctomycetota bacterium]|jgi:prephenate dehydrogenase|nr:prephenate dehydrogenase [Planctomycetota bacterium]